MSHMQHACYSWRAAQPDGHKRKAALQLAAKLVVLRNIGYVRAQGKLPYDSVLCHSSDAWAPVPPMHVANVAQHVHFPGMLSSTWGMLVGSSK